MKILPNIKAELFDDEIVEIWQQKGINITKNLSCSGCGAQFDPNELNNYFEIKFVQEEVIDGVATHYFHDFRKCEPKDLENFNIDE